MTRFRFCPKTFYTSVQAVTGSAWCGGANQTNPPNTKQIKCTKQIEKEKEEVTCVGLLRATSQKLKYFF